MPRSKRTEQVVRLSPGASLGMTDLGIKPPTRIELDEGQIRIRAFERFLARGESEGNALEDWLEAERELRERRWNGVG